jgi:hypothetical protein
MCIKPPSILQYVCNPPLCQVVRVKQLYEELSLEAVYLAYEEESYAKIQVLLKGITTMPTEVFEFLLRKIYKRAK